MVASIFLFYAEPSTFLYSHQFISGSCIIYLQFRPQLYEKCKFLLSEKRMIGRTHVLLVSLIVIVHCHLLEVSHGGWIAVRIRLGYVILGIIYGRRWQTVAQQRVRW